MRVERQERRQHMDITASLNLVLRVGANESTTRGALHLLSEHSTGGHRLHQILTRRQ